MCTHRHTHSCTQRYIHVYTCITQVPTPGTCTHIHTCTHIQAHTHMCTHQCTHIHTCMRTGTNTLTYVHTCITPTSRHMHTHTHPHIHMSVYTCTHTQKQAHRHKGMSTHTNILTGRTGEGTLSSVPPWEGARHVKSIGRNGPEQIFPCHLLAPQSHSEQMDFDSKPTGDLTGGRGD